MTSVTEQSWWESLRHSGLLLSPQQVPKLEAQCRVKDMDPGRCDRLRRELTRLNSGEVTPAEFVTWVLDYVCEFVFAPGSKWSRGPDVPTEWTHTLVSGEVLKPRFVWKGAQGGVLPVFLDKNPRLGIGRGRKSASDVVQWLRLARLPVCLLTNARQWRLVHAGLDYDAFCESDVDLWFVEGTVGPQLRALRLLFQPALFDPDKPGAEPPLAAALAASRRGQSELSALLGERVREAVEELVRAHGDLLKDAGLEANGAEIYRAAVRVVMRLVVVLFAESRGLLPLSHDVYYRSYGLHGLFEQLQRLAGRSRGRLQHRFSAWPRVLGLFRLVYGGSHHEGLPLRAYGGELFAPADPKSKDSLERALRVFETGCFDSRSPAVPDSTVHRMLGLLTRTPVRLPTGWTVTPVDFSDLSSAYIGILYEGLLDYELKTAPAGEPVLFLPVGAEPALPLGRLEAMDDQALASLFEKLKKKEKSLAEGDAEELGDEDDDAEPEDGEVDGENSNDGVVVAELEGERPCESPPDGVGSRQSVAGSEEDSPASDSPVAAARARALAWAKRACLAAGMVAKPRGKLTPEKQLAFVRAVEAKAQELCYRLVLPSEWYLVRWGGTRKGAGSFYTPPQLAVPLVQRTLRPLAYDPPTGEDGKPDQNAPPGRWRPRKPEEILALKVCDPACGSGSFPVAALRFLTDALYAAVFAHSRVTADGDRTVVGLLGLAEGSTAESAGSEMVPCRADDDFFESRLRAVLRRHVVERCIYGVDLDPLAVELCRLALWIETMDARLPFTFLDHKMKCGNSLVGAWFDQFQHYPAMAFDREGGDKSHDSGVRYPKEGWTKALKEFHAKVRDDLKVFIDGGDLFTPVGVDTVRAGHEAALAALAEIHALGVDKAAERQQKYQRLMASPECVRLKQAFDLWCTLWFWPPDQLDKAPLPAQFASGDLPAGAVELVHQTAAQQRFFHWELEFPDVFSAAAHGFNAVLGNPPWEISKPNSKEFFSAVDPLYRTYGKQEALQWQRQYFTESVPAPATDGPAPGPDSIERRWLAYCAGFKSMANWVGSAAAPFGDRVTTDKGGKQTHDLNLGDRGRASFVSSSRRHERWLRVRQQSAGFADPAHPFRHQGSADLNTYKLFLEQAHTLLGPAGRLGFIVPSGVYTDHGSTALRTLFLDHCAWEWLFGFENRQKVFDIDSRFKFCPVIATRGGRTERIRAAFMRHDLSDWEHAEAFALDYPRERILEFSPRSRSILELRSPRDLELLQKMYAHGVLLGDDSPDGWGIQYACEFHMTNDSKLFPPRPKWEEQGYIPDEYGHWLKGNWQPYTSPSTLDTRHPSLAILSRPDGLVLSRDGTKAIRIEDIEDVAVPLYEGRMIDQFDFSAKGWVSGKGRAAVWREIPWENKVIEPQYLMGIADARDRMGDGFDVAKVVIMDIGSATNERTTYAALLASAPCGHTAPVLSAHDPLALVAVADSLAFDACLRIRLGGVHLTWHYLVETFLPRRSAFPHRMADVSARLSEVEAWFAPLRRGSDAPGSPDESWQYAGAVTPHERLRLRCILDAAVAELYGLDVADLAWILHDCDHPVERTMSKAFTRTLDPKGFWRVDKHQPPELRHTVLAQVAFQELKKLGLDAFLALNSGDGWMLPDTLRLADYNLGHDDRARTPQPVAAALGPRFLDWQLAISPEDSWAACRRHAENIRRIRAVGSGQSAVGSGQSQAPSGAEGSAVGGGTPPAAPSTPSPAGQGLRENAAEYSATPPGAAPTPAPGQVDLFGKPIDTDLWGRPVKHKKPRK